MWYSKYDLHAIVVTVKRFPLEYDKDGNGRYDLTQNERFALEVRHIKTIEEWENDD